MIDSNQDEAVKLEAKHRLVHMSQAFTFQEHVDAWLLACFGEDIARDRVERNHRFLEEALELVQACDCSASEAHQLVDYTFGRPVGERGQEVGGVMNTLAALCLAYDLDMAAEGDKEIARCWTKIDRIREKQRTKPKHSPLPEAPTLLPANLNVPDKQEALAGEGVERRAAEAIRSAFFTSVSGEKPHRYHLSLAYPTMEAMHTAEDAIKTWAVAVLEGPTRTLPSNEALAGDDRNGVEGLIQHAQSQCNRYTNGHCSTRRCLIRGGYSGTGAVEGGYDIATCEEHEIALALSRTPSSPQAASDARHHALYGPEPQDGPPDVLCVVESYWSAHEDAVNLGYASLTEALEALAPQADEADVERVPFQGRVQPWMLACFGEVIAGDREERNHRFLEEALELVQACGCTVSEAHQLVDYVYGRPLGEPSQEVGGVMVTLAALCLANGLDMHAAGETELTRIWTKVEQIRAKQAAKPKHSPLPATMTTRPAGGEEVDQALERAALVADYGAERAERDWRHPLQWKAAREVSLEIAEAIRSYKSAGPFALTKPAALAKARGLP